MTNDWRYTDERMQLRQETFLKLKNHFNINEIQLLYEFCHLWKILNISVCVCVCVLAL